jgi:hypothetical protein
MLLRDRIDRRREGLLGIEQDRGVEQPRLVRSRVLERRGVFQDDDGAGVPAGVRPAQRRARPLLREHIEADRVTVVGRHDVRISDVERHRTHRGVGGEEVGHARCNLPPRRLIR